MCVLFPRLRSRRPPSHQHSEQVLSLTAAFILCRLCTGLRQTGSSEVRTRHSIFHQQGSGGCTGPYRVCSCISVCVFYVVLIQNSAFLLFFCRNSSSRERGDNFDRSNRGGDRFDRREERRDDRDRNRLQITKRSFSRENEERSREREQRGSADPVRRVASMTDERDRSSRERARSKENGR